MKRGITWKELLFVCCLFGIPFLILAPVFERAKFDAHRRGCIQNLRRIGRDIQEYRAKHRGKIPRDSDALRKSDSYQDIFFCSLNWEIPYVYRPSNNPNDIICWDGAMHFHARYLLNPAIRNRNVLFGNGKVEAMDEENFQKLNLKGTPILPVNPTK